MQPPRAILSPALAFALVSLPGPVPGPQDAAELLAAQRAGLGDPAALAALGIVQMRGKVAFENVPGQGTFTQILAPSGAARLEVLFEGIPPSLRCTNREVHWMTGTGGVEINRGWSAAADVRMFALARNGDWRVVYAGAELVGEAEVGGRACYELRLVPKSPRELGLEVVEGEEPPAPDVWWLDRESKELVRVAIDAAVSGAGRQRLAVDYGDWRAVAGVRFPYHSRMSFGSADHSIAITLDTERIAVDVSFFVDPFQPDEQVRAALARARSGCALSGGDGGHVR